ncbi:guanylate cyclase [Caenorhabditis elegans]|uniref:guanylate cyclase n=1 Tax=Caenorhabditis elegans TaxID=6239 RepID=A0A5E4LYJ4_CAEEL|nr:guanylate cyclase [Caenorhabditis elegans]VVC12370.1 guanylate cyclase [Caenorhabditis elegans]
MLKSLLIIVIVFLHRELCDGIQLILFDNWPSAQNVCASAVADATANGQCTTKSIQINQQHGCSGDNSVKSASYAINAVASRTSGELDFVFVGPTCTTDIRTIGDFAEIWKSPVIGYEPVFEARGVQELTSVINVAQFSVGGVAETLVFLMKELEQVEITLVGSVKVLPNGLSLSNDLRSYNEIMNSFKIREYVEVDENDVDWTKVDQKIKRGARMIVVCADFYDIYSAFYNIGIRSLSGFRFIIVVILNKPPDEILNQPNVKNLLYGSNAFIISPLQEQYSDAFSIMQDVIPNLADDQFTTFLRIYHACYAYCVGSVNGAETQTDNYHTAMSGKAVTTKYGTFTFDNSGSVLTNYAVFTINPAEMTFESILTLKSVAKSCDTYNCFQLSPNKTSDLLWTLKDMDPPDDCVAKSSCVNYIPHIIAAVVIVTIIVIAIVIIVKQRRHKLNIYKLTWKVPKESLKIIVNKNADAKMQRELENRASNTDNAAALTSRRRVFGSYALVGTQRAEYVQFKQIRKINFPETTLDYLYSLKQLQHDNLAKFYGIQVNDDIMTMTILHTLVERGTLEEFCLDRDFGMDDTFKSAFMRDILKGLQYLHKSSIGYHGHLQASTCLIDINWVLKLTLYGVSNFMSDQLDAENIKVPEQAAHMITYPQYVCFPPEHIREYDDSGKQPPRVVRGSPKGDIYCVGMIFYMMVEREDPYHLIHSVERPNATLIKQILNENHMPRITDDYRQENMLLEMCKECWDRNPDKRPTIKKLIESISTVYPLSKGNLVDQMIRMSEKYADELEQMVAIRTADLADAQMQTMRLLNEMLPASIAKDLKNGLIMPPRSYESATVMFVQICDFNALMKRSSPEQVIAFLNDIYDQFDTVIKRHDAYKVETTGETYMVASGVPHENEGRHIFEVAEISLEIREISYIYVLQHDKNYKLRIRIGFHAGPIAAGVIGIRSPRYCLFGDTVNFASRMQSNCPPNQIQTSEITARLLFDSHEYKFVKRGIVHVKGKGEVNCYWLNEHLHEETEPPLPPMTPVPNPLRRGSIVPLQKA